MAYFTIPFALLYIARRRRDLPSTGLVVCFGVFNRRVRADTRMNVWTVWHAHYWVEGAVKLVAAAASVRPRFCLWRFLPVF